MLANYGFFLLFLCSACCAYGFVGCLAAAKWRHRRMFRSARLAATVSAVLAILASGIVWYALINHDFSLYYVYKNSSTDLPFMFQITAFWSSLEGSHMLWTLFLNICTVVCLWTFSKDNEHIMPYVGAALLVVLSWMFYLACTHSDIFAVTPVFAAEGRGMNTLLQNPYMAIHPPMLFIGYTSLAVPFAYSIAALCYGDVTEGWLKSVRRWTLLSWCFLTAAIILGGRWAYVELGWAGYWAWDPVENSSFLPWLLATSLLHCLLVQGHLGQLKRLTFVLAILAFFLTFFGTFITRSGVITSVHSFAESPIGPSYLLFISGLLMVSSLIYGFRAHLVLPTDTGKVWGVSKESALVVCLLLLLSFASIIFVGTIFPIVSEALTKQRISIQAPYFNAFAPYVGLGLIVTIAVGNLLRFQANGIGKSRKIILYSMLISVPVTWLFAVQAEIFKTLSTFALVTQLVGVYLVFWCASCLTWDLIDRVKLVKGRLSVFFKRSRAFFGAYVAHMGALLMILGFLGNYRGLEQEVSLTAGEPKSVLGYDVTFMSGLEVSKVDNVRLYSAPLEISRNGKLVSRPRPARSQYPTSQDLLNEISVDGGFWRDIYIVLKDFDKNTGKNIIIQMNINPTVRFVWIATFIMVIGGLIALSDSYRGDKTRDVVAGKWEVG